MRRQDTPSTPLNASNTFDPRPPRRILTSPLNANEYLRELAEYENSDNKLRAVVGSREVSRQYLLGSQPAPVHYRMFGLIKRRLDREIRRLRTAMEEFINDP